MTPQRFVAVTPDADRLPMFKIPVVDGSSPAFLGALEQMERGDVAQAWSGLEATSSSDQPADGILLAKTLCCYTRSDFERARAYAAEVAGLVGMTAWLALLIGVCHERCGRREDATQSYIAAFALAVGGTVASTASASQTVVDLLCRLVPNGAPRQIDPVLKRIGWSLHSIGVFAAHGAALTVFAERLTSDVAARALPAAMGGILSFLSLDRLSSTAQLSFLLEWFVAPLIEKLIARDRHRDALSVEALTFRLATGRREDRAAIVELCRRLSPLLADAGRKAARPLDPLPPPVRKTHYSVAFVVQTIVSLAHVETLVDILTAIHSRPDRLISCTLVGLTGANPEIAGRCQVAGIDVFTIDRLGPPGLSIDQQIIEARRELARRGVDAAIWVTSAASASFVLGLRLAPVQIFFAMKYYDFELAEIDAYLTGGPPGQRFGMINGKRWRLAQTLYGDLFDPKLAVEAARIKAAFGPNTVVLGCLAREAKINSPAFIETVVSILRQHPRAIFLWTGRTQLTDIQSRFDDAGLAGRCHFVGWVNTRLYAQVLDIFLDTFPFPCGVTALQAMAAQTPVVSLDSQETREIRIPVFAHQPASIGSGAIEQYSRRADLVASAPDSSHHLVATDATQYVDYASALIRDPAHRKRVGQTMKAIVSEFAANQSACAQSYEQHIVEVIEEAAARRPAA